MHHLSDPARRAAYDTSLVPPQQPPLVAAAPTAPASNFYGKWKTPTFFAAPTGPKSSTNPNAQPTKQKKAKWSNRASPYSTVGFMPDDGKCVLSSPVEMLQLPLAKGELSKLRFAPTVRPPATLPSSRN